MEELEKIATLFYQGFSYDAFQQMEEGTNKILNIVEMLVEISSMDTNKYSLDLNFINAALTEIVNSSENKDGIMVADLLTFEFLDYVGNVLQQWEE